MTIRWSLQGTAPVLSAALLVLACGGREQDPVANTVRDSVGVEIVLNTGEDHPLSWSWTSILRLGGKEIEPETFYQVNRRLVDLDSHGNIYVLDRQAMQLTKFTRAGTAVWTAGGRGGGPGEFLRASQVMALPDGGADVHDFRKRALVHFGAAGEVLGQTAVERRGYWRLGALKAAYFAHRLHRSDDGLFTHRLERYSGADTTVVAQTPLAEARVVQYESCGPDAAQMRSQLYPIFSPELQWHESRTHVAASDGSRYEIDIYDEHGALVRSVRRSVPIQLATRADAQTWAAANPVRFTRGTGTGVVECIIEASEIVDKHTYVDTTPTIGEVALADDGSLWVRQWRMLPDSGSIDVFDAQGAYLGTLPPDFPFPIQFTPAGDLVTVKRDEMDVEWLEILRVRR
jgi:hypothetical protein